MQARKVFIEGIVQGVGFRPFVARLARSLGLAGWVLNDPQGVTVHVQHDGAGALDRFERRVRSDAPAAARVLHVESQPAEPLELDGFEIRASEYGGQRETLVSPDIATCPDCLAELFDPADRRYRYPFINCTNCGPRFTIIDELPYDRPATSMRAFEMCPECAAEYADEHDRRYHAQPDACFECGPTLWWAGSHSPECSNSPASTKAPPVPSAHAELRFHGMRTGDSINPASVQCAAIRRQSDALISLAADRLLAGDVLAVKGLGGWHLACDATNESAVAALRSRKHRPTKPLAVMARDLDAARELCEVSADEAALLSGSVRPIVLLQRVRAGADVAAGVAGDLPELGVMLPSTPVQHLLLAAVDRPLVMTSGNRSGEPIVADDADALDALGAIADGFLGNDRAIVARYDDSVARVRGDGSVQMVRRARGYAPTPLFVDGAPESTDVANRQEICPTVGPLADEAARRVTNLQTIGPTSPAGSSGSAPASAVDLQTISPASPITNSRCFPGVVFAAGPEQKSTFCFMKGRRAYLSQHLGDLERLGAWNAWEEARQRYGRLFDLHADALACDLHPEYLASKWARQQAAELGLPLVEVQHHHAHIASVLGENALDGRVIGIAVDGTGYGEDGTIWGCEVLLADRCGYERFWHLPAFPLPGGAAAIKNPRRSAYALLRAFGELDPQARADAGLQGLTLDNPHWAPFLDGLEERAVLDRMIDRGINSPACNSLGRVFDGVSALLGLCETAGYDGEPACLLEAAAHRELRRGEHPSTGEGGLLTAVGFHANIARALIAAAVRARASSGLERVALSGGCMANRLLADMLRRGLEAEGFAVYENRELPPNDGCIAYGQAIVAAAWLSHV